MTKLSNLLLEGEGIYGYRQMIYSGLLLQGRPTGVREPLLTVHQFGVAVGTRCPIDSWSVGVFSEFGAELHMHCICENEKKPLL